MGFFLLVLLAAIPMACQKSDSSSDGPRKETTVGGPNGVDVKHGGGKGADVKVGGDKGVVVDH
jgi:hypothetical protein